MAQRQQKKKKRRIRSSDDDSGIDSWIDAVTDVTAVPVVERQETVFQYQRGSPDPARLGPGRDLPPTPTGEPWRWIPGYDGVYAINQTGQVSVYAWAGRSVRVREPRWNPQGYQIVRLCDKTRLVARVMLATWKGPAPTRWHHARHLNGVNHDNRIDNLAWGLPMANTEDRLEYGNLFCGGTKVTRRMVRDVFKATGTCVGIAHRFGVTRAFVQRVRRRRSWSDVTADLPDPPPYDRSPGQSVRRKFFAYEVTMFRDAVRDGTASVYQLARDHGVVDATMRALVRGITYRDVGSAPVLPPSVMTHPMDEMTRKRRPDARRRTDAE